ncbi:MAG: hypothetical protein KDE53_15455, partial [Caldilineaceae bacterium]|nr:hypothetical protein [Caldilineaceae bacterium]
IWCWGRNHLGQLGSGDRVDSATPITVTGLSTSTVALAAGYFHTCALTINGNVYCWGSDSRGQLGNGLPNRASAIPVQVIDLPASAVTISAGAEHTCATLTTGEAYCWGNNADGQLGNGTTDTLIGAPVAVSGLTTGTSVIAAGWNFTCAIVNGSVKCWGNGNAGQLGNDRAFSYTSSIPVDVVNLTSPAIDLSVGRTHACAYLQDGSISCWGSSYVGERGGDTLYQSQVPVPVEGLASGVVGISDSQYFHTCAWLQDGQTRCWGLSDFGQLGDGVASVQPSPVKVVIPEQAKWTYMLYLAGDNDLSSYLNNISRVLDKLPDNSDLNVVVFFDGQEKEDSYIWSTRAGGDYELGLHKWKLSESDSNTGDPQTLVHFVEWARANFPADHFYLSIANHGRGTTGTAWDFQNGTYDTSDRLEPSELYEALSQITLNGTQKLDIIHFDSCLMALFETAYQVKDFANYMIASENLTAAFYPYNDYAWHVLRQPTIDARTLAVAIANSYFDQPYLKINGQPRTISVLDLNKVDEGNTKINTLARSLIDNIGSVYTKIENVRTEVQTFDSSPDPTTGEYYTITPDDEYIDLRDFAARIADAGVNDSVKNAANEVTNFLAEDQATGFIVFNEYETGTDNLVSDKEWQLDGSNGVAIYFPTTKRYQPDYEKYVNGNLFHFTAGNDWDDFLVRYFEELQQPVEPQPDPSLPPVLKPTKPITDHCPDSEDNCLWGTVLLDGVPVTATVTLEKADGTTAVMQAAYMKGNEAMPVYAFSLASGEISIGDSITLRATHFDRVREQTIRFAPNSKTGEQEVNILLNQTAAPPLPSEPNPEVY